MRSGNQPFISCQSVRAALDAMLYTSTQQLPSSLEALMLVDHFNSHPDLPPNIENREFALHHLLISMITREYGRHLLNYGLTPPKSDSTLKAASEDIRLATQQHNPELLGWCLLYYRYVRVDLSLSIESIVPITHAEQRTLRRYLNHAIQRLKDCLVLAEWDVRMKQRKVRLYAMLPGSLPISLVGRADILQQIRSALSGQSLRHIQITGPPGIGKSAIVQEFLRQQIDDDRIERLIWIENPESVSFVCQLLNEMLMDDLNMSLKEYTLTCNLVVVLDHFECSGQGCAPELQQLLNELNAAWVFVTSRTYIPLLQGVKHIGVRELNESDSLALIQNAMELFNSDTFDREYAAGIYSAIGGNPYALTLAAHNFSVYRMNTSDVSVLDEVFRQSYDALDNEVRQLWLIFALCPIGEVSMDMLSRLWPSLVDQKRIMTLFQHHLIHPGQKIGHYILPTSSRSFIQSEYAASNIPAALVDSVDQQLTDGLPFAFDIVEHILLSHWPEEQPERTQKWINTCLTEALHRGHYARWVHIIEKFHKRYGIIDLRLNIALGMCLRRVSQWSRAYEVLEQAIFDAGSAGRFSEQGRALLELAILYRQQGYFEKAIKIFEKAERIFSQYVDGDMLNNLNIERAQTALDGGDAQQAQIYLQDLPLTRRTLAMNSEVYLLLGDLARSLNLAYQAISLNGDNLAVVGRLYAAIGRIYSQQDELDNAFSYLARAVTALEREGDIWALARAQSNMGALLIRRGDHYEAYEILSKAENFQVILGDQVGLESTRHNFRVLRGRFGD